MNINEAKDKVKDGFKVTHPSLKMNVFIYENKGVICSHDKTDTPLSDEWWYEYSVEKYDGWELHKDNYLNYMTKGKFEKYHQFIVDEQKSILEVADEVNRILTNQRLNDNTCYIGFYEYKGFKVMQYPYEESYELENIKAIIDDYNKFSHLSIDERKSIIIGHTHIFWY